MFHAVRTGAAAVLIVTALSGCSLIGAVNNPPSAAPTTTQAAGEQTAKEACAILYPVLVEMNTRMTDVYAELQKSGPEGASPALHGISDDMHATLDQLTNAEVHDATQKAVDSLDAMITEIDKIIAGTPDQAALLAASQAVNDDFSAIDPVCQAATAG